jgi:trehalose 6-phosphate phosphatase
VKRSLRGALAEMVESYRGGTSLALLFDYDGTLVPFAPRPDLAVMSRVTQQRLERLAQLPSVFVGVLSGRALEDLKGNVGLNGLYYAGTAGLELDLGGVSIVHPESDRAAHLVTVVVERLEREVAAFPGAWVELKRLGVTVHYRSVDESRIVALRRAVRESVEPFSGALQVLDGPLAIEILPDLGWTKSSALFKIIEVIQQTGARHVFPLCAGDAANDADVLRAADALGGIAIGVGARAPGTARYRLRSPLQLGDYLDALTQMLRATNPPVSLSFARPTTA